MSRSWSPSSFSVSGTKKAIQERAAAASKRIDRGIANVKAMKDTKCVFDQVEMNSNSIENIGKFLVEKFPGKTGGRFTKTVERFKDVSQAADCEAIYALARAKKEPNRSQPGGKRRKSRKRKKSRRRRNKSRRRRKKSRRKRKRRR